VSDLNTQPAPAIEDVCRDERLGLVRLAYLLTGAGDHAEDIVQTAFEAAQTRWDELDDPVAYLRRLVVNRAHDLHRRRYRRRPRPRPEPAIGGRLAGVPAADAYVAELGCTTGDGVST
jgi:DNA-directed RNA polymerase specialized sigma24 family protein